jgi:hypothetical protein
LKAPFILYAEPGKLNVAWLLRRQIDSHLSSEPVGAAVLDTSTLLL